jgi:NAD(P)-dependent dehydrogenase (short-subunit alcohol dehydrogenase family)
VMAVNLDGVFYGMRYQIPAMLEAGGGAIVNIASIAGLLPVVNMPAYGAAKAAAISLTRTLALELAAHKIRVNAICPGMLWTRAWEMAATGMKQGNPALRDLEPRQIFLEVVKRGVPLGEEQTPQEIGELTAYLCSHAARNLTGQALVLDGGQTLKTGQ